MPSIVDRAKAIFGWMQSGPASYPTAIGIPRDRVADPSPPPELTRDQGYFAVRLNQLRLARDRSWWVDVEPMALVVTEFMYDGEQTAIPFVVGPSLIQQHGHPIPDGMLFEDTLVAGPHPYKGGPIAITTILYQIPRTDEARRLLNVVEGVGGVFPAATSLSIYLKVAGVLLDGVESLLGLNGVQAVAGRRHELDPDFADDLGSGFFTVVDQELDPTSIWVKDQRLARHDLGTDTLLDVAGADYLLYRLHTMSERSDVERLPFFDGVREASRAAQADPSEDGWRRAKALMSAAFTHIVDSPDLTSPQGDALRAAYRVRLKALHEEALANADLGPTDEPTRRAAALGDATDVLDL